MLRWLRWLALAVIGIPLVVVIVVGADIVLYAGQSDTAPADAAIVLGAAVDGVTPSPVFEERLRHAVDLYQSGQVKALVMTGGLGPGDMLAEADAGRRFAIVNGVPDIAIFVEQLSHTTRENFLNVLPILAQHNMGRVLVVSDPLHMRRAMRIAEDLGLDAHPSPTPTTRYQTLSTQIPMLLREIYFTLHYAVTGN